MEVKRSFAINGERITNGCELLQAGKAAAVNEFALIIF
jgi:hypothetical protein